MFNNKLAFKKYMGDIGLWEILFMSLNKREILMITF